MDHPDLNVLSFMEDTISLKRVNSEQCLKSDLGGFNPGGPVPTYWKIVDLDVKKRTKQAKQKF